MNKIAIVGRGTAGAYGLTHFHRWTDMEIDWYFDPSVKPQAVGEGANMVFPTSLRKNINFQHHELEKMDGVFKTGIFKSGWGEAPDFFHTFLPPYVSYHFNAHKFQNYVFEMFKDNPRVNIIEKRVDSNDDLDCDIVFDCSGRPKNTDDMHISPYIPVNAVHVTQCYWEFPRFQYTLTIARPYGWVFGIPLGNRCSIGYLYNHKINTLEEVKEDVKAIFEQYNLVPSEDTNSFHFGNYYRKRNQEGRVCYSGNASFFLEPLEATSIEMMEYTQRVAYDYWLGKYSDHESQHFYECKIREMETMIMLHYFAGSKYDTEFWRFAKDRAERCMRKSAHNTLFTEMVKYSRLPMDKMVDYTYIEKDRERNFGSWSLESFKMNLTPLNLYDRLQQIIEQEADLI